MCFSATGQYIPPFLIFPRKNMKMELMNGTPPGSKYACHPSGWIQQDIFVEWLHHFISITKPSAEDPVVLILDGHYSHTKNLEVITVARENHVHIICLPPHSTHRMQPLDVAFMSPFKTYYTQEITNWLRLNPGRVVTGYQVGELFGKAYIKAATMDIAINGFRKAGMFPPDRNIFKEYDFVAEMQEPINEERIETETINAEGIEEETIEEEPSDNNQTKEKTPYRQFTPERQVTPERHVTPEKQVTPADVMPIPTVSKEIIKKKNTRSAKAAIITSAPYKEELEGCKEKRKLPSTSAVKRKISESKPSQKKTKPALPKKKLSKGERKRNERKTYSWSSSSDSGPEPDYQDSDDLEENLEEDAICIFCETPYSEDVRGEEWVKCHSCYKWAHVECAGCEREEYICDFCASK